jgi:hypothetical protein
LEPDGSQDQSYLRFKDVASKKLSNRFHQLLPAPHNQITRTPDHGTDYGVFTLTCTAEISPDPDYSLFG